MRPPLSPPAACGSYDIPLVADIHFQPAVAMRVADAFEKIRINPGNFVDGAKRFDDLELTDESMRIAKEQIQEVRSATLPPPSHLFLSPPPCPLLT